MINSLKNVVVDNYQSYIHGVTKQKENHNFRLAIQILIAAMVTLTLQTVTDEVITVLVTVISILSGFSFAAMFPIAAGAYQGLPDPKFAEEKDNIERIAKLSAVFRKNVSYFIPLSLACLMTFVVQMLDPKLPLLAINWLNNFQNLQAFMREFLKIGAVVVNYLFLALSAFLFLEVLYTFYRMSLTSIFILRLREEYLEKPKSNN